ILHSKVQDARKNCNQTGGENWEQTTAAIIATARTAAGDAFLLEIKAMTLAYMTENGAAFSYAFHYEDWRYNPAMIDQRQAIKSKDLGLAQHQHH
ncbi:MAG: hypothetical protein HRU11_15335, partial [Parvularculaceae bacterium]|nr:hypothetical protein [Parvularculaceae bacterium]